jgi:hypothetical protein
MSQHDFTIDNQGFPAFRADLNNALQALGSTSSGATAPLIPFANQLWYDTTNNILKIRNEDNDAWISLLTLNQTTDALQSVSGLVIGTDVQAYDVDTAKTDVVQSYTKAQRGTPVSLTSTSASIAVDFSLANNFTHTTTENTTLANPTNIVAGQAGIIVITQGATARTLAYGSYWKFASGSVPSLTASASAVDVLVYYAESTTRITTRLIADVR